MARSAHARALAVLAVWGATGCSAESPYSRIQMVDGTASYAVEPAGLAVSGAFTLVVNLDGGAFAAGDRSEIYLHHLWLSQDYDAYQRNPLVQGWDAELVGADRALPYEASVGIESRATFQWAVMVPTTEPSELCRLGFRAEAYLTLGDELEHAYLEPQNGYGPPFEAIHWLVDPCPSPY